MQHGIVEGEPGIFPAPVASLMRKIGSFFDRKRQPDPEPGPQAEPPGDQGGASEPKPPAQETRAADDADNAGTAEGADTAEGPDTSAPPAKGEQGA